MLKACSQRSLKSNLNLLQLVHRSILVAGLLFLGQNDAVHSATHINRNDNISDN